LWFSGTNFKRLGTFIKWNPAIKPIQNKKGLLKTLFYERIDLVTTDHAPQTLDEKKKLYFQSISGAPIVQHSLNIMLEFYKKSLLLLEKIIEKCVMIQRHFTVLKKEDLFVRAILQT
jgi:dihydroorotase